MNILNKIKNLFKKKQPTDESINKASVEQKSEPSHIATGARNYALGIDTIVIPIGKCMHLNRRTINKDRLDGLPISEQDWTHCIFYSESGECYFAGDCSYCKKYTNEELDEIRQKYKNDKSNNKTR